MVSCILKFVQFCFLDKFIPVDDQNRKSPELLFSRFIRCVNRIKKKCSDSSLYQIKWSCDRVFSTVFRKVGCYFSLGISEYVQTDCLFISLKRVYL